MIRSLMLLRRRRMGPCLIVFKSSVVGTISGALVCLACQSGQCCCFDLVDGSIANGVGTTGDTFAAALALFSCDMMLGVW